MPRLTQARVRSQHHALQILTVDQRIEIQTLCGRLRERAREVRSDRTFVPPIDVARVPFSEALRGLAYKIDQRRQLGLSPRYYIKTAEQWLGD